MKIIKGVGGREPDYEPPLLFTKRGHYVGPRALREYVKNEMIAMAEDGTLRVTDLCNQGPTIRDAVGMVLYGVALEGSSPHTARPGQSIPRELLNYRVKIKSIKGDTIKWKDGVEEYATLKPPGRASFFDGQGSDQDLMLKRDVWIDSEVTEDDFDLPTAWKILNQYGKHCRPAKRSGLQDKYWKYEEVFEDKKSDITPARRGRPKAA